VAAFGPVDILVSRPKRSRDARESRIKIEILMFSGIRKYLQLVDMLFGKARFPPANVAEIAREHQRISDEEKHRPLISYPLIGRIYAASVGARRSAVTLAGDGLPAAS
jgi:hypothetical protein